MRMFNVLITVMICTLFYLTVSLAEEIEIKISSTDSKYNNQTRTQKMEDGTFQFVPDENAKPIGYIKVNFTVNGKAKSFKTELRNIFKLGGDYFYYFFECDNGNAFQSEQRPVPSVSPFVRSIEDYNKLDLNVAMQMYRTGDIKQQESAVWIVWKLDYGEQTADILKGLVNGNDIEKLSAAGTISTFRIYHPLINQAVQRRLHEMGYKPGSIDGVLSKYLR